MPLTGVDGRFVFCPLTMTPVQRITAEIRHLNDIFGGVFEYIDLIPTMDG